MPLVTSNNESEKDSSTLQLDFFRFGNWSNSQKKSLYFELQLLLQAGLDINSAFSIIIESLSSPKLKEDLTSIQKSLIRGKSLSSAFAENKNFTPYEVISLNIGAESGKINNVLLSLAQFFEEKDKLNKSIRSALAYPIFVLIVAVLVIWFLLKYMVPMFSGIFNRFGGSLPPITRKIIAASNFVSNHGFTILIVSILTIFLVQRLFRIQKYKHMAQVFIDKIPLIGSVYRDTCLSQMYMSLQLLLESRVQLLHSLNQVNQMIDYRPLNAALSQVIDQVPRGKSLADSMKHTGYFKPREIAMMKIGEETGSLPLMFKKLSAQYQESLSRKAALLNSILEPALILVVGMIVGTILVSIYLPIFRMGVGGPQ